MANITELEQENKQLLARVANLEARLSLQSNENALQLFIEYAPAAIAMFDREMRYIAASRRYLEDYRLTECAVVGKSHYEIFPEIPESWKQIHQRCLGGAVEFAEEDGFPRADGSMDWVRWGIHPWYEKPDQVGGIILFSEVITSRKRIEMALRENEEKYRLLAENISDVIWVLDLKTSHFRYISPSVRLLRGYDVEEVLAQDIAASLTPASARYFAEVLSARLLAFERGISVVYTDEIEQTCKDGATVWTETTTRFVVNPGSGNLEVYGVSRNINQRKRMEAQLTQIAERLALATRAARIGIWDWDIRQNQLVWDDQMYRLYGLQPGEFAGAYQAWLNGLHPEDRAASDEISRQALRGDREYNTEFRVLWPNGSVHWLKADGQVFWDSNGQPLRMIGVNYDITERKYLEESLRESEQKYTLLFEKAAVPTVLLKLPEVVIADANEASEKLTGFTRKEMLGKTSVQLGIARAETRQDVITHFERHGALNGNEVRLFNKHGEERIVLANTARVDIGGEMYAISTMQDITEQKHATENLRRRSEELEQLLDLLPAAIWIADDPECQVIHGNRYASQLLHVLENANVSQSSEQAEVRLRQFSQGRELTPHELPMQVAARTGQPQMDFELHIEGPDKVTRTLLGGAVPLFDAYGETRGAVAAFHDITERKQAEEVLKQTLNDLRISNAELEQFAYVASHDLQEPLRAVAGMVQLLQQKYKGRLDEYADEYIQHLVDAASRMQALINDLLSFSRVDRRGKPLEMVDSGQCLQIALDNLKMTITETHAKIVWGSFPRVYADPSQLTQLFQNLVGNGIKFRGQAEPQIHVSAKQLSDAWQFTVRDNGIGIEPQYFERIFLVFQRLHTRREYPGTGIGLALCKKIVERHGGQIWVESEAGKGSSFHFTIPLRSKP